MATTSKNYDNLCKQLPDLEEHIKDDKVKIIPLPRNSKAPIITKWNTRNYHLTEKITYRNKKGKQFTQVGLQYHTGNYGILIGYNNNKLGYSIGCIDIDGYTINTDDDKEKARIKRETQKYIYEALKDLPNCIQVKTQSGGYHIYYWTKKVKESTSETSKSLYFPQDFPIETLAGKCLNNSIEIFTNNDRKQCVLPSSTIYNKATSQKREYRVISKVNKFSNIDKVDDLNQTVINHLTSKGYTYKPATETTNTSPNNTKTKKGKKKRKHSITNPYNTVKDEPQDRLRELNEEEIEKVIRIVTPVYKLLNDEKHKATLYLFGYFSYHIIKENAVMIAEGIIKAVGDTFDSIGDFKKTALQNYDSKKKKAGLPTLIKLIDERNDTLPPEQQIDTFWFSKTLNSICTFTLYNSGIKLAPNIYQADDIPNYKNGLYRIDDKGKQNFFGNILIKEMVMTYDKLQYEGLDLFKPVLTLKYVNTTINETKTITKKSFEEIAKILYDDHLLTTNSEGMKATLNNIIVESINKDFEDEIIIKAEKDLLRDGFFMDMETNKVIANNVFEELETTPEDIQQAVKLFNEIISKRGTAISHDCSMFRFWLVSPFFFCMKQLGYGDSLKNFVAWGVTNTSKTGTAVNFSYLYTTPDKALRKVNTQSSMGTELGESTLPMILDESKDILNNPDNEEFLKNIVTDIIGRTVKDRTDNSKNQRFPALRGVIFTQNPNPNPKPEFEKRNTILYYTENMKVTQEDKDKFKEKYKPREPDSPLKQFIHLGKVFSEKFIPYLEERSEELYNLDKLTKKLLKEIETEYKVSFNLNVFLNSKENKELVDTENIIRQGLNEHFTRVQKYTYPQKEYMESDFVKCANEGKLGWLDYQPRNENFVINSSVFEKEIQKITGEHIPIKTVFKMLGITGEFLERVKFKTNSVRGVKIDIYNLAYVLLDINIFDEDELEEYQSTTQILESKKLELDNMKEQQINLQEEIRALEDALKKEKEKEAK